MKLKVVVCSMTVGGGFDYRLSRRLSLRPIQADYLFTHFPNGTNDHQNNLRLTTGLAVRFGER